MGVPDVRLDFMSHQQARGELGRYELGSNTIFIDENQLQDDRAAINVGLHELAHAIVYKRNSEYFERKDNRLQFDIHNPLATNALNKLEFKGGHSSEWQRVAANLGVSISQYVDAPKDNSSFGQLRRGLGFSR